MSAPTVEPTTRRADRNKDRLFHFGCVAERLRALTVGSPVRCLCGKVQTRAAVGTKKPTPRLRCVVCADLAPAHVATCPPCTAAVNR